MHTPSGPSRVHFGRFELDRAAGELYHDGTPVRLQEHPRQVLIALLEHPGELVTREDLRERLWKCDTFVDFEHGLNTAVKKARQALGDSAETPQFIETLARRGYRFIGPIEPVERSPGGLGSSPADAVAPSVAPNGAWPVRRWPLWAAAVVLVIGGAVAIWLGRREADTGSSIPVRSPAAAQLAVMPLRVLRLRRIRSTWESGSPTRSQPVLPIRDRSVCGRRRLFCRSRTRSLTLRGSRQRWVFSICCWGVSSPWSTGIELACSS